MDVKKLEAYLSNVAERSELQDKLDNLGHDDSCIGNSVIMDYRTGYPRPQSVVGYDLKLEQHRRERWEKRIEKLTTEIDEVESWIEAIPDGMTRRCFRMRYVDGMSLRQIAGKLHMDRSNVGKKINDFLKLSPNSPKLPL